MAIRTISNVGGNWSANGTWVEGSPPDITMDVVATATSGPVTVDTAACACKTLVLTGYVSTLTFTGGMTLSVNGNVTFVPGMIVAGAGTLASSAATSTLTMAGLTLPRLILNGSVGTLNLVGDLRIAGLFACNASASVLDANITCAQYSCSSTINRTLTISSGRTLAITSAMVIGTFSANVTTINSHSIKASIPSSPAYLVLSGSQNNYITAGTNFTDIDASGSAFKLYNYMGGTLLRAKNIANLLIPPNQFSTVNGCSFIHGVRI